MTETVDWGDRCPDCGAAFPVLYGPHPTWVPCGERPPDDPPYLG